MNTSILLLIVGLFGFITCEILSLLITRYFKLAQIIAVFFGVAAITGLTFPFVEDIFSASVGMPTLLTISVVTALFIMGSITGAVAVYMEFEKKLKNKKAVK